MLVLDDAFEAALLQHLQNALIDFMFPLLNLNVGLGGDDIQQPFALLLLNLEGNALDGALLDSLHEVGGVTSDLVAETFGADFSDMIQDFLVEVEVFVELVVVLLDEFSRGSLDGFGSNSSHVLEFITIGPEN
jgi:hypothetical protein